MKLAGMMADSWEGEELECGGVEAEGPGEGAKELETGGGETVEGPGEVLVSKLRRESSTKDCKGF